MAKDHDSSGCSPGYIDETSRGCSCPSTPEGQIRRMAASPSSLAPFLISDSRFCHDSLREAWAEGFSTDFAAGSPGLPHFSFFGSPELEVHKRAAHIIEQPRSKRPRRTDGVSTDRLPLAESIRVSSFKPLRAPVALSTPPSCQPLCDPFVAPEKQHAKANSVDNTRCCSPQSREIQRILGRWPATRLESCFIPLSPMGQ